MAFSQQERGTGSRLPGQVFSGQQETETVIQIQNGGKCPEMKVFDCHMVELFPFPHLSHVSKGWISRVSYLL